jgi:hypothetical protein
VASGRFCGNLRGLIALAAGSYRVCGLVNSTTGVLNSSINWAECRPPSARDICTKSLIVIFCRAIAYVIGVAV